MLIIAFSIVVVLIGYLTWSIWRRRRKEALLLIRPHKQKLLVLSVGLLLLALLFVLWLVGHLFGVLVLLLLVLIGYLTWNIWRRRKKRALLESPYKQKLKQWEEEGYDVSEFKKKWFK